MSHFDDAAIPITGRFQRIEDTLSRIEEKLDLKANLTEVSRIDSRVLALENGTSPSSQRVVQEVFSLQQNVTTLQMEGSKNLPLLAMIPDLEARVTVLEKQTLTSTAVQNALDTSRGNSNKLKLLVFGLILNAVMALGGIIVQLLKH